MTRQDLVLTPSGIRFQGQTYPCSIGRGGLRFDKAEGDGATPRGNLQVVGMLYRADRLAAPNDWAVPIGPGDLWSDASGQPDYNQAVQAPYGHSHERLRRADPLYDIVWITDWNYPVATAGRGSAIFVHQWRRPHFPTEGCIALRRDHLIDLSARIAPGQRILVP